MTRIVAILGGGDWNDASVTHLVVNDGVDLEEQKKLRDKWYNEVYRKSPKTTQYLSFSGWLIDNGLARRTTDEEVFEFSDE